MTKPNRQRWLKSVIAVGAGVILAIGTQSASAQYACSIFLPRDPSDCTDLYCKLNQCQDSIDGCIMQRGQLMGPSASYSAETGACTCFFGCNISGVPICSQDGDPCLGSGDCCDGLMCTETNSLTGTCYPGPV
jgi:hypothetical protein